MSEKEMKKKFKDYYKKNAEKWKRLIESIRVYNIHGWEGEEVRIDFPIVAFVGENGIGKSTFLRAAVCAYKNEAGRNFYPAQMFLKSVWDEVHMDRAEIAYEIKQGDDKQTYRWRKRKEWGYSPRKKRPKRNVYFLDISRTLPLDATAGYAKVARLSFSSVETETHLEDNSLNSFSYVMGKEYGQAKFVNTTADSKKNIGVIEKDGKLFSQFHQGAGEDMVLDVMKLFEAIPKQSLVVIDEVENSLHPRAQRKFVEYLLKCCKEKHLQILLSTHSPFVLDSLPKESRIMLYRVNEGKKVAYGISTSYALSHLDDTSSPEVYVYVEDDEAYKMFWELIKTDDQLYERISNAVCVVPVGPANLVNEFNKLSLSNSLPNKGFSIVDGDCRDQFKDCLAFPGSSAPEREVFYALKKVNWGNLSDRFNLSEESLYKLFDDIMLEEDHHTWPKLVGDSIKEAGETVWSILVKEWVAMCLSEQEISSFVASVNSRLSKLGIIE